MNLNLCVWEYESVLTEGLFALAHPISCSSEYPKRHPIKLHETGNICGHVINDDTCGYRQRSETQLMKGAVHS